MPAASTDSLPALCSSLRKACSADKELKRVAQELEELLEGLKEESTLSTIAAGLATLSASPSSSSTSSPLQLLLLAHPPESLAVLAEVLNRAVKGLEAALGKRRDRAELSKREREHVEGWEGVMEEVERVCEVYLDDDDEDRPHKVTDEEKEHFSICFLPLANLLKLDLGMRKLRPSILRRVFELFSSSTSRHSTNKIRLTQQRTLGPAPLSHLLFFAADQELTAQALELAFRLGEHIGKTAKEKGVKERWVGHVFSEKVFETKGVGEKCRKLFLGLTVGTYEEKSPAILALLSQSSADCYLSLPCRRLTYGTQRTFSHSDARRASAAAGQFDGSVSLNRATFSASIGEAEEGDQEGEVVERVFEFRWEGVGKVEVLQGKETFSTTIRLRDPPTLDGDPLTPTPGDTAVWLELKKEDFAAFTSALKARRVPLIDTSSRPAPPTSTSSKPPAAPLSAPSHATAKGKSTPAPWATEAPDSAPPLSRRGEKATDKFESPTLAVGGGGGRGTKRRLLDGDDEGGNGGGGGGGGTEVDDLFSPATSAGGKAAKKPRPSSLSLAPVAQQTGVIVPRSAADAAEEEEVEQEEEEGEEGMEEVESLLRGLSQERRREVVRELLSQDDDELGEGGEQEEDGQGIGRDGMEVDQQEDGVAKLADLLNSNPPVALGTHSIDPFPAAPIAPLAATAAAPSTAFLTSSRSATGETAGGKGMEAQQRQQPPLAANPEAAVDPSLDVREQFVSSVLASLSSVILHSFSSRSHLSSTFLTREQALLSGKVKAMVGEVFGKERDALLSLSSSALTAHLSLADTKTLPSLKACAEESRRGVERVREKLGGGKGRGQ